LYTLRPRCAASAITVQADARLMFIRNLLSEYYKHSSLQ
jgi:hypothetical protein